MNKYNNTHVFKAREIHILIINSSEQIADLLRKMLSEFGFNCTHIADSTVEAVAMLRKKKIHLIIADTDIKIPQYTGAEPSAGIGPTKISGFDFVNRIRRSPQSPNRFIPVIMTADILEPEQIAKARDAGVNEVLPKPFTAPELCKKLEAIIDSPRTFITAPAYAGPCRRRAKADQPVAPERRKTEIRVIRHNEHTIRY